MIPALTPPPVDLKTLNLRLTECIKDVIVQAEGNTKLLSEETRVWLAEVLADNVTRRSLKFCNGQREHGGDFLTSPRNMIQEMEQELTDLFFYFERLKFDIVKLNAKLKVGDKL
tara:strand:+ start:4896 stop:5237 length:342 start_codon:yes stop_codon:yes gene_type:complete